MSWRMKIGDSGGLLEDEPEEIPQQEPLLGASPFDYLFPLRFKLKIL